MAKKSDKGLNTGRLTKEEQKFVLDSYLIMTDEEIAKKLKRRVEPVRKFLDKEVPKEREEDEEDKKFLKELKGKVYWRGVNEQFTDKEVKDFEIYWLELIKQFNNDIEFSEEMQLVDLVKLRLLADRNLYERNKARKETEDLGEVYAKFVKKNGPPPYEDHSLTIQESTLMAQLKACEGAYTGRTNEFKIILDKQQNYFNELKATRKQRIEYLKNSKKDWVGLMKSMQDEKLREKEGRELSLMNIAAYKEQERLTEIHIFADGIADKPLLNDESVQEDEEIEDEKRN